MIPSESAKKRERNKLILDFLSNDQPQPQPRIKSSVMDS